MLYWSRYNYCFSSSTHGVLLYNAISNSFWEIPETSRDFFLSLKSGDHFTLNDPLLILQLSTMKCLVSEHEDRELANIVRMKRRTLNYSGESLSLTLAPTRGCNFACVYCYEKDRRPINMTDETARQLVEFVRGYKSIRSLGITWFGGEPLLAVGRIEQLTKEFLSLPIPNYYAEIITNGYLLTKEFAEKLGSLKIRRVQITVDGPKDIHDRRRVLQNGNGTFDRILENIQLLNDTGYNGVVALRVNTDPSNAATYADTFHFFEKRYPNLKLFIHPGMIHSDHEEDGCFFNTDEKVDFYIRQYRQYKLETINFYPRHILHGCIATSKNGYVVGPEGELYKCWADIGNAREVVGHLADKRKWDMRKLGCWLEGQSALNDPKCIECSIMPICDGGCAKKRMERLLSGGKSDYCSFLKKHLAEFLEIAYELKKQ